MRIALTSKEKDVGNKIQELLNGLTLEEAMNALARAKGLVSIACDDLQTRAIYSPKGVNSPL